MNREDAQIGSGSGDGSGGLQGTAEVAAVSKQTTETLMAGERIMEALDIADTEVASFQEYEHHKATLQIGRAHV